MNAIPYILASTSLRAVVLAAIVFLILRLLRVRSAPLEHAAWTTVLGAMLLLPLLTLVLPPLPLPAALGPNPPVLSTSDQVPTPSQAVPTPRTTTASAEPKPAVDTIWWPVAVYLAGVLFFGVRLATGLILSSRLLALSPPIREPRALNALADAASEYPLPALYESSRVTVPVIAGAGEPAILLPLAWRTWDDWTLQAVLAHELTHLRRGDRLTVVLAALNKVVFWFHPLAWWLEKHLSTLAERCSDDEAILRTGDAPRYARALLDICSAAGPRRILMSPLSMAGAGNTGRRIERVLDTPHITTGVLPATAWFAIVSFALPVTGLIAVAAPPQQLAPVGDISPRWQWIAEGHSVTAAQAEEFERRLASNPGDLTARAKLIAYYLYNAMPDKLDAHVDYVIEHQLASTLAGSAPMSTLLPRPVPAHLVERRRQLWRRNVQAHGTDPRVLGNAAEFFLRNDPAEAETLLARLAELEPGAAGWKSKLAGLYSEGLRVRFYLDAGISPPVRWPTPDPAFAQRAKAQMDASTDPALLGTVGTHLAYSVVHSQEFRTGEQTLVDAARREIRLYAQNLLRRAQSLEPANQRWSESLRLLDQSGPAPPPPVPVLGSTGAGRLRISDPATYPPLALQARIQGMVRLQVTIGPDGRANRIKLLSGHPILVPAALEALKRWTFETSTAGETQVDVEFVLPR